MNLFSIIKKNKKAYILLSLIFILLFWQILSTKFDFNLIFPTPYLVFKSLIDLLKEKNTYFIIYNTLIKIVFSCFFSLIIASFLGILSGLNEKIEFFLKPVVEILRCVPVVAVIIILFIYFGNLKTPYIISFLMIFPISYECYLEGIKKVHKKFNSYYKLDSNFNLLVLFKVYLPLIKNDILTNLTQIIGLAIKVVVAAELIVLSPNSIGKEIVMLKNDLHYSKVFAWVIILIVVNMLLNKIKDLVSNKKEVF